MATAATPNSSRLQPPTVHDIGCQVQRDLFGKDVQDTPTASYSWVADQFGHFALGFEITFALSWIFILAGWDHAPTIYLIPVSILVFFALKELSDYVTARRKATQAKSDFPFDQAEILWNMGTAVLYIGLGVVVAAPAVVLTKSWALVPLVMLIPVAGVAIFVGIWWLRRKITFQQAGLPMMYRLAIFPNYLGDGSELKSNIAFVNALIDPTQPAGRHLVIAGPPLAGKSSLATGVGTEFAFKKGIGRYTTLLKLLESSTPVKNPQTDIPTEFQDGRILWPWETADLLIVDDVDFVSDFTRRAEARAVRRFAAATAVVATDPLQSIADALSDRLGTDFLKGLATRRSVWVVGDGSDHETQAWLAMVRRVLGLDSSPDAVKLVHLKMTIEDALAKKGAPIRSSKDRAWLRRNFK
jgi:hypothetical protein